RFNTALNNMSQGLCFFDASRRLIVSNDRYAELYGIAPERVMPGMTLREIVDLRFEAGSFPDMSGEEYLTWRRLVAVSGRSCDSVVETKNGRIIEIKHRPMADGGWVATHEDITERRRAEESIVSLARRDAVTGLANRVLFREYLEMASERARSGVPAALM